MLQISENYIIWQTKNFKTNDAFWNKNRVICQKKGYILIQVIEETKNIFLIFLNIRILLFEAKTKISPLLEFKKIVLAVSRSLLLATLGNNWQTNWDKTAYLALFLIGKSEIQRI